MKKILIIALKLVAITAFAGAMLGVVYSITKEPIANQAIKEANEARRAVFPEAADFAELTVDIPDDYAIIESVYTALDENGEAIGITASVVTKGYSAGLHLTVGLGADGTVKGVLVGSNNETPGLGAKASNETFVSQYRGKEYDVPLEVVKSDATASNEVQAITGATITSRAVTSAVNTVSAFYTDIAGGAQ